MPTDIQEKLAADISTDRMLEIADSLECEIYDYLSDMISKSNSKDFTIKTASKIIADLNAIEDLLYRAVEKLDKTTEKENKPKTHFLEEGKEALDNFNFSHFNSSCWGCEKYKNNKCICNKCYSCTENVRDCRGCRKQDLEDDCMLKETPTSFADILEKEEHIYEPPKFTSNAEKNRYDAYNDLNLDGVVRKLMVNGGEK